MPEDRINLILIVLFTSFFILLLIVAGVLLFRIYLKRKNTLLLEKQKMSIEFEQTLLRSSLEIQEQTFSYISKEIHDNIGQVLSLVKLHLNTLPNADSEKLTNMDQLLAKALTDLRHLSHSLDTDAIRNTGWAPVAEKLLWNLQKTGSVHVSIQIEEDLPTLGNEKPIILFRMIQETINNIIKHAQASAIRFSAEKKDHCILIKIADNGKGFDKNNITPGSGLQNLESRAKMIDANLYIHAAQGSGTEVTIEVHL